MIPKARVRGFLHEVLLTWNGSLPPRKGDGRPRVGWFPESAGSDFPSCPPFILDDDVKGPGMVDVSVSWDVSGL